MNFQAMQFREFIYTFGFLAIGLEIGTFVSTFATPNNNNKSSQDHLTSLSKQKGIYL
jgi:hypothetical protein